MKDYQKEAQDLANKLGLTMQVEFLKCDKHFDSDKENRDIYKITLCKNGRKYSFYFGQSINKSGKYIGHKNMCLNEFGKYMFSEAEYKKLPHQAKQTRQHNVKLNPNFSIPTMYDILACLQKYDCGTFEDFCSEFGYDSDSMSANKIYKAVCSEFVAVERLFSSEEIEQLQEIN